MAYGSLLQNYKIVLLDNPLTAGSTTNSRGSKVVDMAGFDSICTFTTLGATSTLVTVTAQMAASTSAGKRTSPSAGSRKRSWISRSPARC